MIVASFPHEEKREASIFVDNFMKGCRNKAAVLSATDKHPSTLEEAYTSWIQFSCAGLDECAQVPDFQL